MKINFFAKLILKRVKKRWSYVLSFGNVSSSFKKKYELYSCNLYASGAHLQQLIHFASRYPSYLPFFEGFIYFISLRNSKQILLASAFNTLVDEVVDNHISKNKKEQLKKVLFGTNHLVGEKLILRKIGSELIRRGASLNDFLMWAEMEEKNLNKEKDPEDICFRKYGCKSATNLLVWAIDGSKKDREEIFQVAYLVQMIDDVLDINEDKKTNTRTPATELMWDKHTLLNQLKIVKKIYLKKIKNKRVKLLIDETISYYFNWLIEMMSKS